MFDLNDAQPQSMPAGDIIPDGTFAKLRLTIRPGQVDGALPADKGLLKASGSSDAKMLDCEMTVVEGPFWWCSLVDEAVLREWVVNVGSRESERRIAHLFCELYTRLKAVGLTTGGSFVLPITQTQLGDTVGLSGVHVNRSLRSLREAGLVTFRGDLVQVPDISRLQAFAGFKPNYLHLVRKRQPS